MLEPDARNWLRVVVASLVVTAPRGHKVFVACKQQVATA